MDNNKILIVEDEFLVADYISRLLNENGYVVSGIASSGSDALQKVLESPPDLIIMDINLGGEMDGIDTAREILLHNDIPIVYATSYSEQEIVKKSMTTEAYGFILKPFTERELCISIELALYKHSMDKKLRDMNRILKEEVDERKRIEKSFLNLIDNIPLGVIVISTDMKIIQMNEKAREWFPADNQEPYPHCYQRIIIPPRDTICEYCYMEKSLASGDIIVEFKEFPHENGTRHFRIIASPLKDEQNEAIALVELIEDVTEQKQQEREIMRYRNQLESLVEERTGELQEVNQKLIEKINDLAKAHKDRIKIINELERIFNTSSTGMCIIDRNYTIKKINDACSSMFRISKENAVGSKCYEVFNNIHCSTKNCTLKAIEMGEQMKQVELRKDFNDGTDLVYLFSGVRMIGPSGEFDGILHVFTDISAIRKLENEIIALSEKERHSIGRDLHDGLGQMLTGIAFLVESIEKKVIENSRIELKDIKEIAGLVDDSIITTRQLSRGLLPVKMEENGFILALEELAADIERIFNITCRLQINHDIKINDVSEATHLYYIVKEAINNAIKHSNADKINISIKKMGMSYSLSIHNNITVQDNKEKTGSNGLGLNTIKYRSNLIGASMQIDKDKKGFTVKIIKKITNSRRDDDNSKIN